MSERNVIENSSLGRLGGTCSIVLGISNVAVAVIFLLLPPDQQDAAGISPARLLESLAQTSSLYVLGGAIFGLGSLFGIAAVQAISASLPSSNGGWVRWTATLAVLGFSVNAIDSFRRIALDPARAAAYVAGDSAAKAALTVPSATVGLDPNAWLRFGAVGLWILVVSLLALRLGAWPRPLAYVGLALSTAYWLIAISNSLNIQKFTAIVSGIGLIILAPIWYIWLGLRLRKAG